MEYCSRGDLHHYLSNRRSLPAPEAQQVMHQLVEGLHQMHENDFAHRDLKLGVCTMCVARLSLTLLEHSHQVNAAGELVGRTR